MAGVGIVVVIVVASVLVLVVIMALVVMIVTTVVVQVAPGLVMFVHDSTGGSRWWLFNARSVCSCR